MTPLRSMTSFLTFFVHLFSVVLLQEVNATVLVTFGLAAALQVISNMNNQYPSLSHMTRANDIISLYQRFNMRKMTQIPSVNVDTNTLSTLHTIEVLARSKNVFPEEQGFPSVQNSMNFHLQEVSDAMEHHA
jgi:hypothetical protein